MNNGKKLLLWIGIPIVILILAAAGLLTFTKAAVEKVYREAVETADAASYDKAQRTIAEAIDTLKGRLFADEKIGLLGEKSAALLEKEIDRAIADGDLE